MKHEKIDAVEVCKELEDVLAPRLKLSVLDRAVYLHLLRHSRFEGKPRLRFTILWLANNMGLTARRVRQAVRRLVDNNVLRLIERSNIGHLVQVRLPGEVRAPRGTRTGTGGRDKLPGRVNLVSCCLDCNSRKKDLPAEDFLRRLFREGRLSAKDLSARLLAVQALAAGKLRPQVFNGEDTGSARSRLNREEVVGGEKRGPACHRSPSAEPRTEKR